MKKDKLVNLFYVTKELLYEKQMLGAMCEQGLIDEIKYKSVNNKIQLFNRATGSLSANVSFDKSKKFYRFAFRVV